MAAANVADTSNRMFAMYADIRPMGRGVRVCGPALTVKTAMANNLMFHKALSMAQPGDVIVVDCCGDRNQSVCGDVMFRYAKSRGVRSTATVALAIRSPMSAATTRTTSPVVRWVLCRNQPATGPSSISRNCLKQKPGTSM